MRDRSNPAGRGVRDSVDLVPEKQQPHQPCVRVGYKVEKVGEHSPRLVFDHFPKGCGGLFRYFLRDRSNPAGMGVRNTVDLVAAKRQLHQPCIRALHVLRIWYT
jgi:hypothetical protein